MILDLVVDPVARSVEDLSEGIRKVEIHRDEILIKTPTTQERKNSGAVAVDFRNLDVIAVVVAIVDQKVAVHAVVTSAAETVASKKWPYHEITVGLEMADGEKVAETIARETTAFESRLKKSFLYLFRSFVCLERHRSNRL